MIPGIHPAAEVELAAAASAGEQIASGLGDELLAEVQHVLSILCDFPKLGTQLDKQYVASLCPDFQMRPCFV